MNPMKNYLDMVQRWQDQGYSKEDAMRKAAHQIAGGCGRANDPKHQRDMVPISKENHGDFDVSPTKTHDYSGKWV